MHPKRVKIGTRRASYWCNWYGLFVLPIKTEDLSTGFRKTRIPDPLISRSVNAAALAISPREKTKPYLTVGISLFSEC